VQRPAGVGFERVAFEHVAPAPQILVDRFLLFSIRDHRYASIRLRNEELNTAAGDRLSDRGTHRTAHGISATRAYPMRLPSSQYRRS
jgi:hypothetical protein